MKKGLYLLFGLVMFMPLTTKALTGQLDISCDKVKIAHGESIACTLYVNASDGELTNFTGIISYDSDFEVSFTKNNDFIGENSTSISLTTATGKTGKITLGVITLTAKSTATVGNKDLSITNASITGNVVVPSKSLSIRVMSSVNTLDNIKINNSLISGFNGSTTTYNYNTTGSSIEISATKTDANSTLYGDTGSFNLNYGVNVYKIYVNSESGVKKTYTLNVTREDTRSKDNTLKSIVLTAGELTFKSDILSYDVNVGSDVSEIEIATVLNDSKASYVTGYNGKKNSLKIGVNKFEIGVKAENGDIKTYTININREDGRSGDIGTNSITVNNIPLVLTPGVYEYDIKLKYNNEKSNVIVVPTNEKTTVTLSDIDLKVGLNTLKFKLKAENETEQEYTIKITRLSEEESKVYLNKIEVIGYDLGFSKDVTTYNLTLPKNVKTLEFKSFPDDPDVSLTITGNSDLKNGSIITIKVNDDSEIKNTYTINIHKNNDLIFGFISLNILCYIIFGVGLIFFVSSIIYSIKKKRNYYE